MAKAKATVFFCKECGYESSKWMGQCPGCRQWNTMVEEPVSLNSSVKMPARGIGGMNKTIGRNPVKPALLSEISVDEQDRMGTGFDELERVL